MSIETNDLLMVHTPNGMGLPATVLSKRTAVTGVELYTVTYKLGGKDITIEVSQADILGEAYKWYDVTDIVLRYSRHPEPDEILKRPCFIATAAQAAKLRTERTMFLRFDPRSHAGVDSEEEADLLQKMVFGPQAVEEAIYGLVDTHDFGHKLVEDITVTKLPMEEMQLRTGNLHSSECHNFACAHCQKMHCQHPKGKADVTRCMKFVEPHGGQLTEEGDNSYIDNYHSAVSKIDK